MEYTIIQFFGLHRVRHTTKEETSAVKMTEYTTTLEFSLQILGRKIMFYEVKVYIWTKYLAQEVFIKYNKFTSFITINHIIKM